MKIGIMSMQRVANYGSFLQAFGLKQVLEEMGHTVVFIDYKPGKPIVPYSKKALIREKLKNLSVLEKAYFLYQRKLRKNKSFHYTYTSEYLPLLGVSLKKKYHLPVDVLIIGSDEVFNCLQSGTNVGFSKELFGQNSKAKKIITYAASFGNTTYEKMQKYHVDNIVKKWIYDISTISVRDENSKRIVEKMGRKAFKHVDPVFISNFDQFIPNISSKEKYILLYTYDSRKYTEEEIQIIKQFAVNNKKKILTIGKHQWWSDCKIDADPFTMLAYIKAVDFILTDTFHGTVFSIKYNKKFATLIRNNNTEKLEDLLCVFNLKDRKLTDLKDLQKMYDREIDYKPINVIIENESKKSEIYLRKQLII